MYWQEDVNTLKPVDPNAKEVSFNPKYEQLYTPQVRFPVLVSFPEVYISCILKCKWNFVLIVHMFLT